MINRKYLTTGGIILGKRLDLIKNIINTTKFEKNNVLKEVESQSNRNLILKEDDDKTIKKCVAKTVKAKRNNRLKKIEEGPDLKVRPEWVNLNESYNNKFYKQPTIQEKNRINRFFNSTEVAYEWSVGDFSMIPGETACSSENSVQNDNDCKNSKIDQGKRKIPFQLINGLPEIVFLGRSNAGKSSILNNLVTEFKRNKIIEVAKMSKRAGFTRTLNCFNIGNKFRLIDTPGYGYGSNIGQGTVAMEYLEKRKELRRCYVLLSANHGITELDLSMIENLIVLGKPFEIVFTKMDKIKDLSQFDDMIVQSEIQNLSTLPKLIFTNSVSSKRCPKRYGMDYLRYSIFESCGLV